MNNPANPNDETDPVVGFDEVKASELDWIANRRKLARDRIQQQSGGGDNVSPGSPQADLVGLALSGGGIRSATFNLGLLQALERSKLLAQVDYLSTVSGGGYIGSSLTWFKSKLSTTKVGDKYEVCKEKLANNFPFGTKLEDHRTLGGHVLRWLRDHGTYLTPGNGLDMWALIGATLTGTIVNLIILLPVLAFLVFVLSAPIPGFEGRQWFDLIRFFGYLLLGLFLLHGVIYALATGLSEFGRWGSIRARHFISWRRMREVMGRFLMIGLMLVAVGALPVVYDKITAFTDWTLTAISTISASGAVALLGALIGRKPGSEVRGLRPLVLSLGLILLNYGLFLGLYHLLGADFDWHRHWGWLLPALSLSLILAIIANVNHVSMHRYYRNRLKEAYMPYEVLEVPDEKVGGSQAAPDSIGAFRVDEQAAERFRLHEIPTTDAPYQIVCANVQMVGSDDPKLRKRGGDSFVFSPLYCGAPCTGYAKSEHYVGGKMNLATAMSISGAALDPNTKQTRSRPLTMLMTLLNLRLGYWIRNPRRPAIKLRDLSRPWWYWYMWSEAFGKGLHENRHHVHLSDGGHFENLGLYELVRRRCRIIIVADAGADSEWTFSDLARAIELVRVDFGAKIDFEHGIDRLLPRSDDRISGAAFVIGRVYYREKDNDPANDPDFGYLVYIKTTLIKGLPEDIYAYKRAHPKFPDKSTVDQFFDETEFEAYRELGYQIGRELCKASPATFQILIDDLLKEAPAEPAQQSATPEPRNHSPMDG